MRILCAFVTLLALSLPTRAAAEVASASVGVTVQVSARTSLHVSSELLRFDVADDHGTATAAVDFSAAARVRAGSGLVLTVEPLRALDGPGGAADVDAAITFAGDGEGLADGALAIAGPTVAGRWHGSGVRTGHLVFTLHASAAGAYALPVRFVLSAP